MNRQALGDLADHDLMAKEKETKKKKYKMLASVIKSTIEDVTPLFNGSVKINFHNGSVRNIEFKKMI